MYKYYKGVSVLYSESLCGIICNYPYNTFKIRFKLTVSFGGKTMRVIV